MPDALSYSACPAQYILRVYDCSGPCFCRRMIWTFLTSALIASRPIATGFTPDEPRFSLRSIRFRAKHVRALSSTSRALGAIAENDLYSCYILKVRIQEHFAVVDFLPLIITVGSNILLNLNWNKERTCIAQKSPVYFQWIVWRVVKPVWTFSTWLDISNEEDLKIIANEANIFFLILSS